MNNLDDLLAQRAAIRAEIDDLKARGQLVQAALKLKNQLVYLDVRIYLQDPSKVTDIDGLLVQCVGNERYQGDQDRFLYKGQDVCSDCLGFREGGTVCIVCDAPAGKCTHEKDDLAIPSRTESDHFLCICEYTD